MPDQDGIELRWIFGVLRRWIWFIIGCLVAVILIVLVVTFFIPPSYSASVSMMVEPSEDMKTNGYNDVVTGQRLAITYSQIVVGRPILETVITKLGLSETPNSLSKKIVAETIKDTQLIRLTVRESSAKQAALLANTIATAFTDHVQSLQTERYNTSLAGIQDKMNAISANMDSSQAKIDALKAKSIEKGAELTRLQSLFDGYRSDYRSLQQSYQTLQLTVAELTDKIHVVEPAQMSVKTYPTVSVATTTILVDQSLITGGSNYYSPATERLTLTYGQMLTSHSLMQAVITKLGLNETADSLASRVSIEAVPNTQLIRLKVEDVNSGLAKLLADNISEIFISQIRDLLATPYTERLADIQTQMNDLSTTIDQTLAQIQTLTNERASVDTELVPQENLLAGYRSDYQAFQQDYEQLRLNAAKASNTVTIVEPAYTPDKPVQQRPLYLTIAAVVGLILGIGLAFLLEQLGDRIRTSQDVSAVLELSTLSSVTRFTPGEDELIVDSAPNSQIGENFRVLSTNILSAGANQPMKTLLITSPTAAEGKSFIAANLALTFTRTGLNVVIVDGDTRLPRLHQMFGLPRGKGLIDSISKGSVGSLLQQTKWKGLKFLQSGEATANIAELFSSPNLVKVINDLAQKADIVIIDCPPVLAMADATILASKVDGVLLVLRSGYSRSQNAREAVRSLLQVNAHLIGTVVNAVPREKSRYYTYYTDEEKSTSFLPKAWQWVRNTFQSVLKKVKVSFVRLATSLLTISKRE